MMPIRALRHLFRSLVGESDFKGKSHAVRYAERLFLKCQPESHQEETRINGFSLRLDLTLSSHRDMYYGLYETPEVRFMKRNLLESSVFFDVGSAIGYYAAQAAAVIGDKGSIHCFEPVPRFFSMLKDNLTRSSVRAHVHLNCVAVSAETGHCLIAIDDGKSRVLTAGHAAASTSSGTRMVSAPTITLDEYMDQRGLGNVDFLKLDVEGHELQALKGLRRHFEAGIRPTILTEIGWEDSSDLRESLIAYLSGLGYRSYLLCSRELRPLDFASVPQPTHRSGSMNVAWIAGDA